MCLAPPLDRQAGPGVPSQHPVCSKHVFPSGAITDMPTLAGNPEASRVSGATFQSATQALNIGQERAWDFPIAASTAKFA